MLSSKPNYYYIFLVLIVSAGYIPKGYDEGGYSASVGLPSFIDDFNLRPEQWEHDPAGLASRVSNIESFGVLGAALGSLISLLFNDRFGRLISYRIYALVWATGLIVQIFSSGKYGLLLFARVWGGLGAGGLSVITSLFLSEIAPARSRGLVISCGMFFLLSFLSLGFFINFAANATMAATRTQYRLVQAIPLIPAGLGFCASWFFHDTPRWLVSRDRSADGLEVLRRLRGPRAAAVLVQAEFQQIKDEVHATAQAREGMSTFTLAKELVTVPSYRERFLLALAIQLVAQWSGGNGITYYVPQIFKYAGITGESVALLSSGAYGVVKLFFTMSSALFLVDRFGRRPLILMGLLLQLASHIYLGVYMGRSFSGKSPSDGAIAMVYVYALGWSVGLTVVQSIYGTEIFPTRVRSVAYSFVMGVHWFSQFAVVQVTPLMFVSLHVWGAYLFWALICATGLLLLGIWTPETKGVPIEKMDELFEGRWWMGWRAKISQSLDISEDDYTEKSRRVILAEIS